LKIGGVIVAPIRASIWRYTKQGPGRWDAEEFPGFAFVPLVREGGEKQETGNRKQETKNGDKRRKEKNGQSRSVAFCVLIAAGATAYALLAPVTLPKPVRINIAPGSGSRAIADQLKLKDTIRSKWLFLAYAALTGRSSSLKPGTYEFGERIAIPSLVALLVRGEPYPNERFITIPEGWDLRDIGNYLESNGVATRRDLYAITGEPARRYDRNRRFPPAEFAGVPSIIAAKPPSAILEGWLYPDTYRVFRDASAADIVAKMLENFDRKLTPDLHTEIGRRGKSVADTITLASLIEKEVAGPEDRHVVSGILWGRLEAGMPLQVDATVNYITGKHETPSAADLAIDSPYNTYRYRGLPPTPIANPGIDAIRAAVFPQASDYAYYLSTPEGETIFSRTFEEHTRAKTQYLR
ncbi:MAG: endolytic transglycosylase MltG, partial [bacterium]|nr:endolytic transglycosylase MltG [bacterium]